MEKVVSFYRQAMIVLNSFTFLDVPLFQYVLFLALSIGSIIGFSLLKKILISKIIYFYEKKGKSHDYIVYSLKDIKTFFIIICGFYIGSRFTNISDSFDKLMSSIFVVGLIYEIVIFFQKIGMNFIQRFWEMNSDEEEDTSQAVNGLSLILKIVLWSVGLILILSNLGFQISALVASLGVSSIAVAFALQNILADIFSSFSIYLDTPFKVNDFIIVGNDMGIVKRIGIKSTRIQTLQGEELIISNHELTNVRVRNFKQMKQRRIVFSFGVTYSTAAVKLKKIPEIVKKIIDDLPDTTFDRAHFKEFANSSLNFEVVYYVNSPDYVVYMDNQEKINLQLFEIFKKNKIEFAFPTQTIYMGK